MTKPKEQVQIICLSINQPISSSSLFTNDGLLKAAHWIHDIHVWKKKKIYSLIYTKETDEKWWKISEFPEKQ